MCNYTHTHAHTQTQEDFINSNGEAVDDDRHPLYTLYAVIIHSGNSANVGHYYAFARGTVAYLPHDEEAHR